MKKLVLVAFLIIAVAATCSAEQKLNPVLYLGGGISMPIGPQVFKDYWKMGVGFGGGIGFQLNPNMELIADIYYNQFSFDDSKFLSDIGVTGASVDGLEFKMLEVMADFKYAFTSGQGESKFKPFLIGGVGIGAAKFADATVTGDLGTKTVPASSISESKVMFGAGAGFDYMFSPKAAFWLLGRFNIVSTSGESTTYLPVRAGVKFMLGSSTE